VVGRDTGDLLRKWVGVHVKIKMNQKVHIIIDVAIMEVMRSVSTVLCWTRG
jgi:hypothetical protein